MPVGEAGNRVVLEEVSVEAFTLRPVIRSVVSKRVQVCIEGRLREFSLDIQHGPHRVVLPGYPQEPLEVQVLQTIPHSPDGGRGQREVAPPYG